MNITNTVNMDLQQPSYVPAISVVQKDWYSRAIALNLYSGGEAWEIPDSATALICYSKLDGKGGEYDTLPDGTTAWSVSGNVLTVILAPQVVTTAGPVSLAVSLLDGREQISTFLLLLHVQPAVGGEKEDSEEYAYITGLLPAPFSAKVGQFIRVSAINEKGQVTAVNAIDLDALEQENATDEELLTSTYTLTEADYIYGMWNGSLDAGCEIPYTTTDIGNKFCTRKFKTTMVPKISYYNFTTPSEYVFWNDGEFAGKMTWSELSENWTVGFDFDEVAVNFSWGWNYVGSEVIVRMSIAVASFDKVLVLGDSISTDYYGSYTKWVTVLIENGFFPANTTNDSIHATGFVARYTAEDASATNDFISRLEAVADKDTYDLVVIFGGINDYIQAIPLGESGGDKTAQFVPAVDYFFEYLVNNFTQAKIAVLSPLRTYNQYANAEGHYQTAYADYIRQAAKSYCLPVLNLTEESGFCPFVDSFKNMWTLIPDGYEDADGVHPNAEYQKKFLAPMIRDFLERFV